MRKVRYCGISCGLQSIRDVLLVSYFEDTIDDVELTVLYEENCSRENVEFTVLYEENYSRELFPEVQQV